MKVEECQFLVVNGILTKSSDINGWTDLAEDYYQDRDIIASKYDYFSTATTNWIYQNKRVREVVTLVKRSLRPVIYVGHSNAGDIFSGVVLNSRCKFPAVHLFAPATNCDFNKNGFNAALKNGRIGKLYIYGSNNDPALKLASSLVGRALGFGALGRLGPKNVDPDIKDRVILDWRDHFGHSDWLSKKYLKDSLALTLRI